MLLGLDSALFLLASTFGGGAAFFFGREAYGRAKRAWRKWVLRKQEGHEQIADRLLGDLPGVSTLSAWALKEMAQESRLIESGSRRPALARFLGESAWLEARLDAAGLRGVVSAAAFWEVRARAAVLGAALGGVAGACLSPQVAGLLALLGLAAGWRLPKSAVAECVKVRADHMERHLAEMLDVMALGLRSGLSFERSLDLYLGHFDSMLAQSFERAKVQWSCGLMTREEALRNVAASYDSPVMARVVEDMVRSLRFGSSLAEGLEMAAEEVRSSYRSRKEEQVAKAPVKMMVPTGALILPAMLILVLGPVLLELMEGF